MKRRGWALRTRYGCAAHAHRAFSVEMRWAGYPAEYEVVHAKTDEGAERAALHASMRAAARTGRGRADKVIIHSDSGTKAEHALHLRGTHR